MDAVSLPDPGDFHRGLRNGHSPGLVINDLAPFDVDPDGLDLHDALDDTDLPGDGGNLPLDAADIGDMLAAPGFGLTPDVVDEQTRALEAEFRAELERFDIQGLPTTDTEGGSSCNLAHEEDSTACASCCNLAQEQGGSALLPSFETLTYADLDRTRLAPCPDWCADADLPLHGDGHDTTSETDIPHRGVPHDIPVKHGGSGLDHAGRAEVSLQVEQDRKRASVPVVTLSVVVRGIEQYAWLTAAETRALHHTLGQLLEDAAGHN